MSHKSSSKRDTIKKTDIIQGEQKMRLQDTHSVQINSDIKDAESFARRLLESTPTWLLTLLSARDAMIGWMGFATQNKDRSQLDLREGGVAGPFKFSHVSPAEVVGGSSDRHISFESTFFITTSGFERAGHLRTVARSHSRVGALYLNLIWPAHKLLMHRLLTNSFAAGARSVRISERDTSTK
ncbi:DUF2867 domain-containing protein [Dermacoccus nishinomiyaensis]